MSTALPLPPNATLVKLCQNCHHTEEEHLLSPPSYASSDGLPTFEGCAGGGYYGDPNDDESMDYPEFVCQCWEFEDPDAVEPEDDTNTFIDCYPYNDAHDRLRYR